MIGRAVNELPLKTKQKIAYYSNIPEGNVFSNPDASSVYSVPIGFHEQGLDNLLVEKLKLGESAKKINLEKWVDFVNKCEETKNQKKEIKLGIIAKYMDNHDCYKSVLEAITHASYNQRIKVKTVFVDSSLLKEEKEEWDKLDDLDCIIVPGGFGERGTKGKILAIKKCREKNIPFLGICYGMQMACIEYARHVAGVEAFHEEITPEKQDSEYIIHLLREFMDREGHIQKRTEETNKGGT